MLKKIEDSEIHVWIYSLKSLNKKSSIDDYLPFLSEDEKQRAYKFIFEKHKSSNIYSRGLLRERLSDYTGIKPEEIEFSYSAAGKPALANKNYADIKFNVSHSEDLIAIAFSSGNEVGIDVEHVRHMNDLEGMINYNFSDFERDRIKGYNGDGRRDLFFSFWAHKEAYIKATGDGVVFNIARVEFTIADKGLKLYRVKGKEIEPDDWSVFQLDLKDYNDYAGALIIKNSKKIKNINLKYQF